ARKNTAPDGVCRKTIPWSPRTTPRRVRNWPSRWAWARAAANPPARPASKSGPNKKQTPAFPAKGGRFAVRDKESRSGRLHRLARAPEADRPHGGFTGQFLIHSRIGPRLAHGIVVGVQQDDGVGQEQGAIQVGRLADHRQGVQLAPLDDLAGGMEVDV